MRQSPLAQRRTTSPRPRDARHHPYERRLKGREPTGWGRCRSRLVPEFRIDGVPQTVAEKVHGEDDDENCKTRHDGEPGRIENILEPLADHPAPCRCWRL